MATRSSKPEPASLSRRSKNIMIKYLLMILLALTTAAICDEKESRARKIESATKGKTITFSERAYFSNTSDFSGNKFPFNDKESFKYDYVNLHHPFSSSTLSSGVISPVLFRRNSLSSLSCLISLFSECSLRVLGESDANLPQRRSPFDSGIRQWP